MTISQEDTVLVMITTTKKPFGLWIFGYDSLMVTDDLKHIRWYNAKSRYLKSMKPKLGNSMEGINAIIKLKKTEILAYHV